MRLTILLAFLSAPAFASCPVIRGHVVLFGGNLSRSSAMQPCYPELTTIGQDEASQSGLLECLADQINRAKGEKFTIAGHSTGGANAEHLARKVADKSRIHLVLLDGFGAKQNQNGIRSNCWYGKYEDGKRSLNASSMDEICSVKPTTFEAPWCKTEICAHFALVNLHAPADLSFRTYGAHGYDACKGNTSWLEE